MKWFVFWCCLCCIGGASAFSMNVSVNVSTGNDSVVYYPGGNVSFNSTAEVLFSVGVPGQNISLNLSSGSSTLLSGIYDSLFLYCASSNNQNASCSVTKNMTGLETFNYTSGACDLHFSCQNASPYAQHTCFYDGNYTNVTVLKNITIDKTGNLFSVTLDNKTTLISQDFSNASQSVTVAYTCPVELKNISKDVDGQELFEICTSYGPLFADWLNLTLNRCFDNFDAYRDFVNSRDIVVAKANQDLSDCRASNGQKDGQINVLNQQTANLNDIISRDQEREQIYVIVMSLLFFLVIGLVVGVVVLAHRAGAEG